MPLADKLSRGPRPAAVRLLIHGPPGVGKSTFAANAPDLLLFDFENRTDHLDIARRVNPASWVEFMDMLTELRNAVRDKSGEFGKTRWLVVDTLDAAELLIMKHVCDEAKVRSVEDFSWGKGYVKVYEQWVRFLGAVDQFRVLGVNVLLLAHSVVRMVRSPGADDYECWGLSLKETRNSRTTDLFRNRVDAIGFAHWEDIAKKPVNERERVRVITTGERLLSFTHNPHYETKAGILLPDEIPLSWNALSDVLTKENS